ncbi:MAG: hypothetical protein GF331_21715 [Chitinivibrionales bacterium]|nr:hypothetical protein [Chitinivibrionales bacterium]
MRRVRNGYSPKGWYSTHWGTAVTNHEILEPLDFLAELTQHIPDKGEHQIRYYGHYSSFSYCTSFGVR